MALDTTPKPRSAQPPPDEGEFQKTPAKQPWIYLLWGLAEHPNGQNRGATPGCPGQPQPDPTDGGLVAKWRGQNDLFSPASLRDLFETIIVPSRVMLEELDNEQRLEEVTGAMVAAPESLPPELVEALCAIREMSTPAGMDSLLREFHSRAIPLPFEDPYRHRSKTHGGE